MKDGLVTAVPFTLSLTEAAEAVPLRRVRAAIEAINNDLSFFMNWNAPLGVSVIGTKSRMELKTIA
ncbi:hypothetical protein D3C73_1603430 [compost metagenome]